VTALSDGATRCGGQLCLLPAWPPPVSIPIPPQQANMKKSGMPRINATHTNADVDLREICRRPI